MLKTSKLHPKRPPLTQTHRSYLIVKMYFMMYYCHVVWIVVECGTKRDTGASLPYCTLAKNTDDVFVFLLGYCTLKNKTGYLYLYLV